MNHACVNVQIYYINYFNNSKACRDRALRRVPPSRRECYLSQRVRSFGRKRAGSEGSSTRPARIVNRRRKSDISVCSVGRPNWIAFPSEILVHFLIVCNRVTGRVKLGKNPHVRLQHLPGASQSEFSTMRLIKFEDNGNR